MYPNNFLIKPMRFAISLRNTGTNHGNSYLLTPLHPYPNVSSPAIYIPFLADSPLNSNKYTCIHIAGPRIQSRGNAVAASSK